MSESARDTIRVAVLTHITLSEVVSECLNGTTLGELLVAHHLGAPAGVWGKVRPLDYVLRDGDRIETYAPLRADPKDARRAKANRRGSR